MDCHSSGLAYKIGFDKSRLRDLCKHMAFIYPHAIPSRRTLHVLHHDDICIESDVTRSLHGLLIDCDFVVRTTHVTKCDGCIVMRVVKQKVSNTCISASSCRASTQCDLILNLSHVQVVIQGVRDDAMRDVTWYNVQVHGDDEEAVRSEATRIASFPFETF